MFVKRFCSIFSTIGIVPDESDEEDEEEQEEQEEQELDEIEDDGEINLETLISKNQNTSTLNLSQITLSDTDIKVLGNILQSNKVRKQIFLIENYHLIRFEKILYTLFIPHLDMYSSLIDHYK